MKSKIISLSENVGFIKYFKNISWLMFENILRMLVALIVGVYVARYLGPDDFGLLSYVISFVTLFSVIPALGLESIIVRELVKRPERSNIYLGTAFRLKLFTSIITIVLIAIILLFKTDEPKTNLYVLIVAFGMIFQSFKIVESYFQANVLNKYLAYARSSQVLLLALIKIFMVFLKLPLLWFVWATLAEQIILGSFLLLIYFRRRVGNFIFRFDLSIAKKVLKDSLPLMFSSVAIIIYMKIDQVMLKEMIGSREVGIYAVGIKFSEIWHFIPIALSTSLLPAILNSKIKSEELYKKRMQKFYFMMMWISIVITLSVFIGSGFVIKLLYGASYIEAISVLKIHIWSLIFVFIGTASSQWLLAENLQKYSLYRTVIGCVVNIILNLVLIPRMGADGAAYATVISFGISAFFALFIWKNTRNVFYSILRSINPKLVFEK